jgi:anti-sigma factor RsiW
MTRTADLTCQELVELVTNYLDDALSGTTRARFDRHLSGCDGCSAYLRQMRDTIRVTGAITEEQLEPAQRDRLLRAFRTWRDG